MTAEISPLDDASQSEPCPTPLAWQEVVKSFRESAQSRVFTTDDADVTVTEFGQGPPLVFFPGLAGGPLLFALTAWLLKDEFRSLLFEHPRYRVRPAPRDLIKCTSENWAMAVEHLCPQGADLYACSLGSQIALKTMASYPRLIRSAVLQGAWAVRSLTWAERSLLQLGRWSPFSIRRTPLWLSAQIQNHRRWFPPFDETRFGFLLNETGQTPTRDVADRLLAAGRTDLTGLLPSLPQQILILHCEGEGRVIDQTQQELQRRLPRAQSEAMPLAGQYPYLTHPHRLVKIIRSFLTQVGAETTT